MMNRKVVHFINWRKKDEEHLDRILVRRMKGDFLSKFLMDIKKNKEDKCKNDSCNHDAVSRYGDVYSVIVAVEFAYSS